MHPHQYTDDESQEPKVHDVQIVDEGQEPAAPADEAPIATRPARNQLSREASERISAAAKARWSQYRADRKAAQPDQDGESSKAVVVMPVGDIQLTGTVAGVRQWIDLAGRFQRCQVACQVMAGFELAAVKRAAGFVQGGLRGQNRSNSGFATWADFLRAEIGITDKTATNWMMMADAARPRLKKLKGFGALLRDIVSKPVSELTAGENAMLTDAVHKLVDGRTQLEFMLDLGIAKAPQGSAAKGGNLGQGAASTPSDEDMRKVVRESWTHIAERLSLEKESFTLLDDPQVEALIDYTDRLNRAMRGWLRTPKAERGPEAVNKAKELLA